MDLVASIMRAAWQTTYKPRSLKTYWKMLYTLISCRLLITTMLETIRGPGSLARLLSAATSVCSSTMFC